MKKIFALISVIIFASISFSATIRWEGNAIAVAQETKFTPGNVEIGDKFTLTATGLDGSEASVSYIAEAATVADVTAGLEEAWNESTDVLMTAVTASDETTYLLLTADTAGIAFEVDSSTLNGGSTDDQTLTEAAVTANTGPHNWDNGDNWSGDSIPGGASGQDVYIENSDVDIWYGLDQSGISNALDSLNIDQSFTGAIGSDGVGGYSADYLQIKTSALKIGYHIGAQNLTGSGRLKIDLGSTACTVNVYNSGSPADTDKPSIRLKANTASTNVNVLKGSVGIAFESSETSTVGTVKSLYTTNRTTDVDLFIGSGVTITTLRQTGGDVYLGAGLTTATIEGGTLETNGSGAITTFNCEGGSVESNSTGTITTLNITGGTIDFTATEESRTVTTLKLEAGGALLYDPDVLTITNKVDSDNPVKLTATTP